MIIPLMLVTNLITSLKKQLKENWVSLFLDLIGIIFIFIITVIGWNLADSIHQDEAKQKNTPLFKYGYNRENQSIIVDFGNDFSPVTILWLIPKTNTATIKATTTLVGILKNDLEVNDIVKKTELFIQLNGGRPIEDDNFRAYLKCKILDGFEDFSSTLSGFPIGVEIKYVVRGTVDVKTHYDLILLKNFDFGSLQVYLAPSLNSASTSETELKNYLLERGNNKLDQLLQRISYDEGKPYLDEKGACSETSEQFFEIPLQE